MGGHNVTGSGSGYVDSPRFSLKNWGLWNRGLTNAEMHGLWDPSTRWDLYHELGRRTYFFPSVGGIDTRQKRFSMMGFGDGTYIHTKFEADGTIDADDRAHLLDLYSGIALAAPEEEGIIGSLGLLGVGL